MQLDLKAVPVVLPFPVRLPCGAPVPGLFQQPVACFPVLGMDDQVDVAHRAELRDRIQFGNQRSLDHKVRNSGSCKHSADLRHRLLAARLKQAGREGFIAETSQYFRRNESFSLGVNNPCDLVAPGILQQHVPVKAVHLFGPASVQVVGQDLDKR